MKTLSLIGTLAMFMVGGGILLHGLPHSHEMLTHASDAAQNIPGIGELFAGLTPTILNALTGILSGGIMMLGIKTVNAGISKLKKTA